MLILGLFFLFDLRIVTCRICLLFVCIAIVLRYI